MATTVGYKGDLYIASQNSIAFSNKVLTDPGDHANYALSTSDAQRYWDDAVATTVQTSPDGTTWTTVTTGFTINYVGGKVTFSPAKPAGTQVRVSGSYLPITQVGEADEWEIAVASDVLDASHFGQQWKTRKDGINSVTGKFHKWYIDTTFMSPQILGQKFVLLFYLNFSAGTRYEGYARMKQDGIKAALEALVDEDIDFELVSQLNFVP